MSGGGSKTEYVTSNRTTEPAAFIKPFLEYGANEAQRLYQSDLPQYYPQSTVVGFAPQQEMALRGIEQRALAGSPLSAAAVNETMKTLSGSFLGGADRGGGNYISANIAGQFIPQSQMSNAFNDATIAGNYLSDARASDALNASTIGGSFLSGGNPYLQQAIQNAAQPTIDAVQSQFSAAGRLGSGANMDVLSRNVGQIAQNMAFANYGDERTRQMQASNMAIGRYDAERQRQMQAAAASMAQDEAARQRQMQAAGLGLGQMEAERQRQMQALGMAPAMAAQDYVDFNVLAGVGDARRQQSQAELQDQINRFNFEQNTPAEKLAKYMALVGGGQFGSTGTDTRPVFSNPLAEGLGLATGAAGLGNMLFGRGGGLTAPGLLRGANGNIFGMG